MSRVKRVMEGLSAPLSEGRCRPSGETGSAEAGRWRCPLGDVARGPGGEGVIRVGPDIRGGITLEDVPDLSAAVNRTAIPE